jgi:hypothetical protein
MTPTQRDLASIDWERVDALYAFTRRRAVERVHAAERQHADGPTRAARHELMVIETLYAEARHHDHVVTGCAVLYLRARALRDAQHADFSGEWIRSSASR